MSLLLALTGASGADGEVAGATSATTTQAVAGTQTHAGAASNASSATAASTPAGTQSHQGVVSAAGAATALSTPAGTLEPTGPNVSGATSGTEVSSVAGQYVPPAGTQETVTGGWPYFDKPRKKKREQWREELDALFAKPVEVVPAIQPVPQLGKTAQAYIETLRATIARAQQEQAQWDALATAERKADEAQERLNQAIEAEQTARRQIRQFDIAFVAAVLADL